MGVDKRNIFFFTPLNFKAQFTVHLSPVSNAVCFWCGWNYCGRSTLQLRSKNQFQTCTHKSNKERHLVMALINQIPYNLRQKNGSNLLNRNYKYFYDFIHNLIFTLNSAFTKQKLLLADIFLWCVYDWLTSYWRYRHNVSIG